MMPRTKKRIDTKHPVYIENQRKLKEFWEDEATDMNRKLAKQRHNGKTEYVQPHMRGTTEIEGYFRRPPPRKVS